jgi:aldehyde oxidoreductase
MSDLSKVQCPIFTKGVGEPALIAAPAAILNAIHDAAGVRVRQIPATPDRVRLAIQNKQSENAGIGARA